MKFYLNNCVHSATYFSTGLTMLFVVIFGEGLFSSPATQASLERSRWLDISSYNALLAALSDKFLVYFLTISSLSDQFLVFVLTLGNLSDQFLVYVLTISSYS